MELRPKNPAKEHQIAACRKRLEAALGTEGVVLPGEDTRELCEMAWRFAGGAEPRFDLVFERVTRAFGVNVAADARRMRSALAAFEVAHQDSSSITACTLTEELRERGIEADTVGRVLSGTLDALNKMAGTRVSLHRQGNPKTPRGEWILAAWRVLSERGVGMRPASRIIGSLFGFAPSRADTIYQAIRNQMK